MDEKGLRLMRLLGNREAFAAVSGRCSAAEAEAIRQIHDEKLYLAFDMTWDEFCPKRLGAHRRNIERMLRPLYEFGPSYYHVAQMTHVTPDEYRAIAPHVSADGVCVDGSVIALLPENSEQVSAAVAKLLEREKPAKAEKASMSFDAVMKRCKTVEGFVREQRLDEPQRRSLGIALAKIVIAASRQGIQVPRV
jgi:hypothetical protein